MIVGLQHIAIYTRDIDATKNFYVSGLGFRITWEGMVRVKSGVALACTAVLGTCVLELVLPPNLNDVHNIAGPVQHFALQTNNLKETIVELSKNGIAIIEPPEFITYEGGVNHAFIYGPSNERIELFEKL